MAVMEHEVPLFGYVIVIGVGILFLLFVTLMLSAYGNKNGCTEQVTAKAANLEGSDGIEVKPLELHDQKYTTWFLRAL